MLCKHTLAYFLFGPPKWAQFIYKHFCLAKRPEERTFNALVYAQSFFYWGHSDIWWDHVLDIEITNQSVKCLLCPWSFAWLFGLYDWLSSTWARIDSARHGPVMTRLNMDSMPTRPWPVVNYARLGSGLTLLNLGSGQLSSNWAQTDSVWLGLR